VIVDLASGSGGNCELTRPGQVVEVDGRLAGRHHQFARHGAAARQPALHPQRHQPAPSTWAAN
jgi:hypothetical protein